MISSGNDLLKFYKNKKAWFMRGLSERRIAC